MNLAVQTDNVQILRLLLTNPNFTINEPIDLFSLVVQNVDHRKSPLIRLLLADSRVNPLVGYMDFDRESLDDDSVVVLAAFIKIKCPFSLCDVREFIYNAPAFAPELAKLFLYLNHQKELTDALIKLIFEYATAVNNQRFLKNTQTLISSISLLLEAGIRSESLYDAIFRNPKKALIIAKAFVIFHQIGFLNQYLQQKIIAHAEQAKDLSLIFVFLKNIGLLANQRDELELFKLAKYAKPLIAVIELFSKSDLLIARDYDIELMSDIPIKRIFNKIVISQNQKLICHFDPNGKVTEIMIGDTAEQILRDLQLHYLLTKQLNQNEILNHSVDYKILTKIYQLVENAGCNTSIDNRATNFEMLCKNVEHIEPVFGILKELQSVNLLTQSTLNLIVANIQHTSALTILLPLLTYFRSFDLEQCKSILVKAKYADDLASALQCLRSLVMYQYNFVSVLCNCPEYAQDIVSILYNLRQTNPVLIGQNNLIAIEKNAKYSANILSACCALKENNKLNQDTFDLLMENPRRVITTALENGGIMVRGNDGLTDFARTYLAVKIMKSRKFFWDNDNPASTLPDEVACRIIELAGDDYLDSESRGELIKSFF